LGHSGQYASGQVGTAFVVSCCVVLISHTGQVTTAFVVTCCVGQAGHAGQSVGGFVVHTGQAGQVGAGHVVCDKVEYGCAQSAPQ
jgi:hypothetical protein